MSTNRASTANGAQPAPEKTYFEQQREMLVGEIAQVSMPARLLAAPSPAPCHPNTTPESRARPAKHQQAKPLPGRSHPSRHRVRARGIAMEPLRERHGQGSE